MTGVLVARDAYSGVHLTGWTAEVEQGQTSVVLQLLVPDLRDAAALQAVLHAVPQAEPPPRDAGWGCEDADFDCDDPKAREAARFIRNTAWQIESAAPRFDPEVPGWLFWGGITAGVLVLAALAGLVAL